MATRVPLMSEPIINQECYDTCELDTIADIIKEYADKQPWGSLLSRRKVRDSLDTFLEQRQLFFIRHPTTEEMLGAFAVCAFYDWWSEEPLMGEVFVVSTSETYAGVGRLAVECMLEMMSTYNFQFIQSGNLVSDEPVMVSNMYLEKMGYTGSYQCFYKFKE